MTDQTRRAFIKGSGAAIAGAAGLSTLSTSVAAENGWTTVESPTTKTLNGAVLAANGPWAAGGGGDVIERTADGWVKRLDYGPVLASNELTCIDATSDGAAIWFAGGSGVIGEMDVVTKTLTDHSAPGGKTSTWEGIAVSGTSGEDETISLVNGSGEELTGYRQSDGSIKWEEVVKPGGGSSMKGMDTFGPDSFTCVNTNAKAYASTDGATTWSEIGIDGSEVGLYGIAAVASDDMNVAAGDGIIYRYDGSRWTGRKVGSKSIKAIDRLSELGLAAGGSGRVFRRQQIGSWERYQTPTENNLNGCLLGGEAYPDVAVGSTGTIVEKQT